MATQAPGRSVSALLKGRIWQESPHRAELGRGAGSAGRLAILLEPSTGGAAGNAELGLLEIVPGCRIGEAAAGTGKTGVRGFPGWVVTLVSQWRGAGTRMWRMRMMLWMKALSKGDCKGCRKREACGKAALVPLIHLPVEDCPYPQPKGSSTQLRGFGLKPHTRWRKTTVLRTWACELRTQE